MQKFNREQNQMMSMTSGAYSSLRSSEIKSPGFMTDAKLETVQ